jgi:hypothetical protein
MKYDMEKCPLHVQNEYTMVIMAILSSIQNKTQSKNRATYSNKHVSVVTWITVLSNTVLLQHIQFAFPWFYIHFKWSLQKLKQKIYNYNFACCFIWAWDMVPHFNVRTHIEGEREQVLRTTTVPNREEWTGERSFTTCTLRQILFRQKNQNDVMCRACSMH